MGGGIFWRERLDRDELRGRPRCLCALRADPEGMPRPCSYRKVGLAVLTRQQALCGPGGPRPLD